MVQITLSLHSTFKEISNEYSHAQIRVKTKKLWPRQVGEEKQVDVKKVCHDQEVCRDQESMLRPGSMSRTGEYVATRKVCRDQESMSRPEMLQKPKKGRKLSF